MKKWMSIVGVLALALAGYVMIASASPASGVQPTLLARGTYEEFKVKAAHESPFQFKAEARPKVDMVVRQHDYVVGGSTGWHTHPGPVFITVLEGALTFYEYDDPTCTPHVVTAGHGYVDTGGGHLARNEGAEPARDISVIIAPVGLPFRGELPETSPNCSADIR